MEKNIFINEAVARVGGQTEVAKITGAKSYQTVQQWMASGRVPAKFCAALELASGIPRHKFRPHDGHKIWPELKEPSHA